MFLALGEELGGMLEGRLTCSSYTTGTKRVCKTCVMLLTIPGPIPNTFGGFSYAKRP